MKGIAKRFNKQQQPAWFDERELKINLGEENFIFIGSSNDLFANDIPDEWIVKTFDHCRKFQENTYLFQSKNPMRIARMMWKGKIYNNLRYIFCTTIESNRDYPEFMGNAPKIDDRFYGLSMIDSNATYLTIEPIMDFDLKIFVDKIKNIHQAHLSYYVKQVNIGADSGNNHLPEPSKEKLLEFISELEKFTTVKQKTNLKRLLK
jgi:hypothetical protein